MHYGIFYNAQAGSGQAATVAKQLASQLKKHQHTSEYLVATSAKRAIQTVSQAVPALDCLVIIGGDGTLNVGLTGMLQAKHAIPLGVIPMGTVNNFAKRYQIPQDPNEAIDVIVTAANQRQVGIALVNDQQVVVSSLTVGHLATIANDVHQRDKQRWGRLIYLGKLIQHFGKRHLMKIRYQLDQQAPKVRTTRQALLTTTKSIGGLPYKRSVAGKMNLTIVGRWRWRQFELRQVRLLPVDKQTVTTRIDGDVGPKLPINIRYAPDWLTLLIP
ncbi:diacylglycerol/lipid kinase family protein [Lactiplantibacillus mudanjiangensis]|uniref:Diacylglycerol kinase [Lactobacillus pentosus] n=1 Tax=Lactiplantibacillus mudanjiangensis TaxID=1296538 RepID=A0A660DYJ9_9LACO|nr:diacylglycerol kinase family protein [Lactiplantibacillus mudanjiangensis]VDG18483.1 diacylglycerol kinase [Lactobacillus pentosus] [Lactiplantibacillus mudanjiangensis]VDG25926.1 diacylglycerol kinase [Lactobacillus pentosus] [Lactiplantibacillus mudanjiangensis]VDG28850.1 diacylglycerol kinase [Lactobacillus pentosus] [Lactiplantibacillus mudanjiangensis]VDG33757.1 diacylglycerol kinase [Lactobacillus pentosus] [Lactiplantibacillus mudanjiangensis]